MLATATRQDLEGVKSTIISQMIPRSFMQSLVESLRTSILQNVQALHIENQQLTRVGQLHREQLTQRMNMMEQEVKLLHNQMSRIIEQQARIVALLQR